MNRTAVAIIGGCACLLGALSSTLGSSTANAAPPLAATAATTAPLRTPSVAPAQLEFRPNVYQGVSALSADDVWAVGNSTAGGQWAALIRHWDGASWTTTRGPRVPGGNGVYLNAVQAFAPNDVWTVGDRFTGGDRDFLALAAHWDGSAWTKVAIPRPGSSSDLATVTGTSSDDIWALGSYPSIDGGNPAERPLAEHWDGHSWTQVPTDTAGMGWLAQASSAVAISPSDVWFVGVNQVQSFRDPVPLVEHWNGTSWTQVKVPHPTTTDIEAVGADQQGDVWVVGGYTDPRTGIAHPMTAERIAGRWHRVPLQHRQIDGVFMHAIAARSGSDVWTVGQKLYDGANGYRALAEHWDGSAWRTARSEDPYRPNQETVLLALSLDGSDDAWAAGYYATPQTYVPLVEHWNGTKWVAVP